MRFWRREQHLLNGLKRKGISFMPNS
ncbi:rCG26690 [Rattus norvegicus]|uniref:RCG26690 n=1 Tax=Rattus norvegicus TaxID=10116 RepID=A6HMP3_RAT|nr:rCG26690 [Rattus norvegicus]